MTSREGPQVPAGLKLLIFVLLIGLLLATTACNIQETIETQMEGFRADINNLTDTLQTEMESLKAELAALRSELSAYHEEIRALTEEMKALREEIGRLP